MNLVKKIVDKFGGQSALAELIGKGQSAVAYWVKTGNIPSKWHSKLLALASEKGISLNADDFMQAVEVESVTPEVLHTETSPDTQMAVQPASFLFYSSGDGSIKIQISVGDETVWASQKAMAEIFDVEPNTIAYHLKNIFESRELIESAVTRKIRATAFDNKAYLTTFYNLDVIISVGYRVNSYEATQFRKWATKILKDYLIKGYVLNDDRLKQGKQIFGKDYFDDLLERIREIRASERRFYQKITDIFSQCSIDYDKNSPITQQFYAHVQDKLHWAIHGHTAAELIETRADANKPNMGLCSWKNEAKKGKITKNDVTVGKNYLTKEELDDMNRLVSMYLDTAENFARRQKAMTMKDWLVRLDNFLEFNAYDVLKNHGSTRRDDAERHAVSEYEIFRIKQDQEFKSDFDEVVDQIKTKKELPKSEKTEN